MPEEDDQEVGSIAALPWSSPEEGQTATVAAVISAAKYRNSTVEIDSSIEFEYISCIYIYIYLHIWMHSYLSLYIWASLKNIYFNIYIYIHDPIKLRLTNIVGSHS